VTAILRRLQKFGGVCIPSIVRDSKCGHHLLLAPKTLVYIWVGWQKRCGGVGSFPLSPSPHTNNQKISCSGGGGGGGGGGEQVVR